MGILRALSARVHARRDHSPPRRAVGHGDTRADATTVVAAAAVMTQGKGLFALVTRACWSLMLGAA